MATVYRVGVLLDLNGHLNGHLNDGSILFFKHGVQHGPGYYAAGCVTGPAVHACSFIQGKLAVSGCFKMGSVRLLQDAAWPAGHEEGVLVTRRECWSCSMGREGGGHKQEGGKKRYLQMQHTMQGKND
jgi:hypothetical protein